MTPYPFRFIIRSGCLVVWPEATGFSFTRRKAKVDIFNYLPNGATFQIHCKSKNNDLGVHVIGPGQKYELSFTPNIWGRTLFFCGVSWSGGHFVFDIYRDRRDNMDRCKHYCRWHVTKDAVIGFREDGPNADIVIPWNK
ncbi:hypothetical protein CRG98_041762 [Punica granatum]|uniref:S-protein homolog n=1 Tax=Punica granatum TaxID=22663 RepID=A0A2I0I1J5_PUNGR|nr:hypothetical protein CRG98_041762 [Punica granatum]